MWACLSTQDRVCRFGIQLWRRKFIVQYQEEISGMLFNAFQVEDFKVFFKRKKNIKEVTTARIVGSVKGFFFFFFIGQLIKSEVFKVAVKATKKKWLRKSRCRS